ncbi:hypothetical protein LG634_09620 [Streptomyces bambusae]|uniref:hypothetical protein n=1 Tax=Streptomyces bambusae TaxID=1550616 RepID=UPI001CFC653C|nr:hypothetical protein [Streptomyces bambusae]MCB5165085.1 hypothetical protein [Streptomyces bambusae]
MARFRTTAATLGTALALAACSPAADPPPPDSAGDRPPASSSSSARSAPAPAPTGDQPRPTTPAPRSDRLLTVTRSGGYAGEHKSILIASDGTYRRLDHGRETSKGRLTGARLARLRDVLEAADFQELPRVSTDPRSFDTFMYAFVHAGREVAAQETVMPPRLAAVLAALPPF